MFCIILNFRLNVKYIFYTNAKIIFNHNTHRILYFILFYKHYVNRHKKRIKNKLLYEFNNLNHRLLCENI